MRSSAFLSALNRIASHINLKTLKPKADVIPGEVDKSPRESLRRCAMTRRLVPLKRLVEEAKDRGDDLDSLFIDRDDIVEIDEDPEED